MKKTFKIIGKAVRYIIGGFFVLMSFASLNAGHPVYFLRTIGFGILLLPVFYKTVNEKRMYKPKCEVFFPIIWFAIFSILIYVFKL